jgi:hypothetical protein
MGVAKRSLSPGLDDCTDQSSEDALFSYCLMGQTDIRIFCTQFGAGYPPKMLRKTASSGLVAEEDVLPLMKLPGQRDIRCFFQRNANYQAACGMGLDSCLDNDEDERNHVDTIAAEISETNRLHDEWNMALASAEEAAVSMGLCFGMGEDMEEFLEGVAEDILRASLREEVEFPTEDMYETDAEAARSMGLSLSIDDEDCVGQVEKKPRLEESRCPVIATTPKRRALKEEKETPRQNSKRLRVTKETPGIYKTKAMDSMSARSPCAVDVVADTCRLWHLLGCA